MRAMIYSGGSDLDGLRLEERPAPPVPGEGEVSVRVHASSLNYDDYLVVRGQLGAAAGRIPLSDAGGVVTAVGAGVRELGVGDAVVSCFFPEWQAGLPPRGDFSRTPGDGIDGFARETVTVPINAFTRAPRGWSHAEAATITTAGVTAWRALVVNGGLKAGDSVLLLGTGGVSIYALQIAKAMAAGDHRRTHPSSRRAVRRRCPRRRCQGAEQDLLRYRAGRDRRAYRRADQRRRLSGH